MNSAPIIICAPEFEERLKQSLNYGTVVAYSDNMDICVKQISELDKQNIRETVILFKCFYPPLSNQRVKDHINLSKDNPLIGPADLSKGPRFPDMSSVYESNNDGIIVVVGEDKHLQDFKENLIQVTGGIWEAIALKHRGYKIYAWVIADLEKWINEKVKSGLFVNKQI